MADRKKVIKGIECCLSGDIGACERCPYEEVCHSSIDKGPSPLRMDVLELIRLKNESEEIKKTEQETAVPQSDVPDIMNRINNVLMEMGYVAVGYDNTDVFLNIIIDKQ